MTLSWDEYQYLRSRGGTPVARKGKYADNPGQAVEWNFGLLRPDHPGGSKLTPEYEAAASKALKALKLFRHTLTVNDDTEYIDLTKVWNHPEVVRALGKPFIGYGQTTGSCVGCGGGNNLTTLCFLEVLLKGEPEKLYLPFWGVMYGRSRYYMGDRGRGEGSLESCWAKATADGALDLATPGLPTFTDRGGDLHMGSNLELAWSDGDSRPLTDFLDASRKHPIQSASRCRSAEDVWNAIGELKVVGQGSMYGYNVVGTDEGGEALGKRGPRWSHKQVILGRRVRNGRREFKLVNSWKYQGHKLVWIPEADVNWICQDECFAYEGLSGIPDEQREWIDWTTLPR